MRRVLAVLAATVFLAAAAPPDSPADSPVGVVEPDGYWLGALQGYTPATLKGATVVDAAGVAALVSAGKAVLIDVSAMDRRPPDMPPTRIWLPVHRDIPGSVWLPGAGEGNLDPAAEAALKARLAALTEGDPERPVITYCHPDCWGSWNLGKRLVGLGYRRVYWFPQGIEGWEETNPTATAKPDVEWSARPKSIPDR